MLKHLTLISALLLASCAAFFSISGIVALFSGAAIAVGFMAFAIEVAKIITISVLYRNWKTFSKALRTYLVIALVIASCITTAGIYGYLTQAYSSVATNTRVIESHVSLLSNQQQALNQQISQLSDRAKQLGDIRVQQEHRLDSLVGKNGFLTQQNVVRRTEADLQTTENNITKLSAHRDSLATQQNTSENTITTDAHIGPFYYFSKALGLSLDDIVKWFILIIVAVFDPLSISLFFAYNSMNSKKKEKHIEVKEEKKEEIAVIEEKVLEEVEEIKEEVQKVIPQAGDTRYGQSIS